VVLVHFCGISFQSLPLLWLDVGLPTGSSGVVVVEVEAVGAGRGLAAGVGGSGGVVAEVTMDSGQSLAARGGGRSLPVLK